MRNEIDPLQKLKGDVLQKGGTFIDGQNVDALAPKSPFREVIQENRAAIVIGQDKVPTVI